MCAVKQRAQKKRKQHEQGNRRPPSAFKARGHREEPAIGSPRSRAGTSTKCRSQRRLQFPSISRLNRLTDIAKEAHKLDQRVRQRRDQAVKYSGADGKRQHQTRRTHPTKTRTALQLLTQNLQGFAKTGGTTTRWFDGFRSKRDGLKVDAIFVQETRAHDHWPKTLAAQYENAWGFAAGTLETPLSYWSQSERPAGGVAILLHPEADFQDLHPLWQDLWNQHWIALHGRHDGAPVTLINIYGPTAAKEREALFNRLAGLQRPEGMVIVGGDFNCTQDAELDRSRTTIKDYSSRALTRWLFAWDLIDGTTADALAAEETARIQEFHARHHTYYYGLSGGNAASCRLDRWYTDKGSAERVLQVDVDVPVVQADHQAVFLQLSHATPRRITKTRRQVLRYPLPRCAAPAVKTMSSALLERAAPALLEGTAKDWDQMKTKIRRACLQEKRRRLKLTTAAYRRRVFRLRHALKNAVRGPSREPTTIESLTDDMERLSVEPSARVKALRHSLIAIRRAHLARRSRAKFAQYAGRGALSTRSFYKRISVKFSTRRTVALPPDATRPSVLADRLAEDWRPITQQAPVDPALQDAFFASLPTRDSLEDFSSTDEPFTEAEVYAAIKTCPRGKASGPDGIPNDWYRDQIEVLPSILAPLFTSWYHKQTLPQSFRQATVYCIPKNSRPQSGLDYRPIALLNTDYKIYARVLLNRVRGFLPAMVAETQFGFVPGRQVHDAIDVWTATKRMVLEGQVESTAMALMLDFAKAYDTLDRRFLLLALRRLGFTDAFASAVGVMHLATTASYLADGSESSDQAVTTGIRQGCPLVPVLFVLALNTLYELVTNDTRTQGIQLTNEVTIKIAGFADDTSMFLRTAAEAAPCLELLQTFGNVSGLRVNVGKSHGVLLHPRGREQDLEGLTVKVLADSQLFRHLGAQIATTPSRAAIWELTHQQLRARLVLAQVKTMNLGQRVEICRAVILPKLLFVGRHSWPSRATIDKLQKLIHNYAWHGQLTMETQSGRAWLNPETAQLPVSQGGLALPNMLQEFERLAAKTAARWTQATTAATAATGAVMLWKPHRGRHYKTPIPVTRTIPPEVRYGDTIAITGARILRHITAQPRDEDELALLDEAWNGDIGPDTPAAWTGEWLFLTVAHKMTALAHLGNHQHARHGLFQLAALSRASLDDGDILLGSDGNALRRKDFAGAASGATIGDIVQIERIDAWTVRCRQLDQPRRQSEKRADGFRRFCEALVVNYPALVLPQNPVDYLQPHPATLARWAIEQTPRGFALRWEPVNNASQQLGIITTARDAARLARTVDPSVRSFMKHPWLSATSTIWASRTARSDAEQYTTVITAATRTRGRHVVAAKKKQLARESPELMLGLDALTWRAIAALSHSTSGQRLLLIRLKHMRLGGWDRLHNCRGCPHCPLLGAAAATTGHTVWECEAAQQMWGVVREYWRTLGAWESTNDDDLFRDACMSLRLTRVPTEAWKLPALQAIDPSDDAAVVQVHEVFAELWQRHCLAAIRLIWRWRCGLHDPHDKWSAGQAIALWTAEARGGLLNMIDSSKCEEQKAEKLALLCDLSSRSSDSVTRDESTTMADRYILFFDGGSRGNPGPGGSGAVIVATDATGTTSRLVWAAAMSYGAADMTNNRAEYLGAIAGLQAAWRSGWKPLEVVGDSALILGQLRDYRPPTNGLLRPLYAKARVFADKLGVSRWSRHYRAHNKMADAAANIAMDTRSSIQVLFPTQRKEFAIIPGLLADDFQQWQDALYARDQRLLPQD